MVSVRTICQASYLRACTFTYFIAGLFRFFIKMNDSPSSCVRVNSDPFIDFKCRQKLHEFVYCIIAPLLRQKILFQQNINEINSVNCKML